MSKEHRNQLKEQMVEYVSKNLLELKDTDRVVVGSRFWDDRTERNVYLMKFRYFKKVGLGRLYITYYKYDWENCEKAGIYIRSSFERTFTDSLH